MSQRAILVVDLQKEYLSTGKLALVGIDRAVIHAAAVIAEARAKGDLVVTIVHESADPAAPVFTPGTEGVECIPTLLPQAGEPLVIKHYPNSFLKTELQAVLDDKKIKEVVVIGAMSHMCIDATARAAFDLGYQVTVVEDACATLDLTFGEQVIPAAQVHAAFMSALAFAYGRIVSTQAYLAG